MWQEAKHFLFEIGEIFEEVKVTNQPEWAFRDMAPVVG